MNDYVSPRLFALIALVVLVGATLYLADRLSPPAVAAILAGLGNVVYQVLSKAGGVEGDKGRGASLPDSSPEPEVSGKAPPRLAFASLGPLAAAFGFSGLAVALAVWVSFVSGCGHTTPATRAHVVELLTGECAEIARFHQGTDARRVELICNLVEGAAGVVGKNATNEADASAAESD